MAGETYTVSTGSHASYTRHREEVILGFTTRPRPAVRYFFFSLPGLAGCRSAEVSSGLLGTSAARGYNMTAGTGTAFSGLPCVFVQR